MQHKKQISKVYSNKKENLIYKIVLGYVLLLLSSGAEYFSSFLTTKKYKN